MTSTTPALTASQAAIVGQARAVLDQESPSVYELADMAKRVGALEHHLGQLLALVGQLAQDAR